MRSPGETSFKAFQKMQRFTEGIKEKQLDTIQRGQAGEDTAAEFMDLVKKKTMAYQGMSAMLKLNHKPLQKILDESR
jgi:hypothetical protein